MAATMRSGAALVMQGAFDARLLLVVVGFGAMCPELIHVIEER